MRTLVSTIVVGVCLVGGPALAQQHPWVPSGTYTNNLQNGDAPARAYGRSSSGKIVDAVGWRSSKSQADELYDSSCNSSHPLFACPGSGGQ
jgi:hypothetical protein